MDRPPRPYGHVAWCYDAIASAYSLGAIDRAKRWHVGRLKPGDRVLYAGAGTGREVVRACATGVEVVCIEPCPAMARRLRQRLRPWADRAVVVERPLLAAEGGGAYDWVCGHFFFNVFDAASMPGQVMVAASHVKPGGRLVVADFAPACAGHHSRPSGNGGRGARGTKGMSRLLRALYYRPVNVAGWALRICALHPIYDYAPPLRVLGFEVEERVGFASIPGVPAFYEVVCARKSGAAEAAPPGVCLD